MPVLAESCAEYGPQRASGKLRGASRVMLTADQAGSLYGDSWLTDFSSS